MLKASRSKPVRCLSCNLKSQIFFVAAALILTGCQTIGSSLGNAPSGDSVGSKVTSFNSPVGDATIQLYAMKSGAASEPLLTQTVKSSSTGSFSISGLYTCPSATAQTYLVATGGTPEISGGVPNSQAALATLLGPCGSITTGQFAVNEVTTIAAESAMMADLSSMTKIGSASTAAQLTADYTTFTELVNPTTGTAPGLTEPAGYEVQVSKLNAMADILATCVNSKGGKAGDGSACGTLFTETITMDGSPVPTDTFMAGRGMARDFNLDLSKSLALAQSNPPYTPELTSEPSDWNLKLVPTTATPVISPVSGKYAAGTMVTITDATPGAVIHFTTNGTEATCSTPAYTGPFALVSSATVNASAISGNVCSLFATPAVYTITSGSTSKPQSLTLSVPADSITVGSSYQGTLSTSGATNVATVVTLSSSSPAAIAVTPTTVTIPAGQTSGTFTYSGEGVGSATLTATATGYTSSSTTVSATSTVVPANYTPLANATIQLYAMQSGAASEPLLTQPLKSSSNGSFSIRGLYTCPSATAQTYLVATGGTPVISGGVPNSQAALATLLGPCGSITTTGFVVNEVTTMAALSAVRNDLTSMKQIGSNSTAAQLASDYASFLQLVNPVNGTTPGLTVPAGYLAPTTKLNAMADILATCLNSAGGKAGDGSPCGILFSETTTFDGSPIPTDTFMAARGMARDINLNLSQSLALAQNKPPFTPELTSEPSDWNLSLLPTTATPVISPASGQYPAGTVVTITDATPGAVIHFTVDGTEATCSTPVYTGPFELVSAATVNASASVGSACSLFATPTVYTIKAGTSVKPLSLTLSVPANSIALGSSYQGTLSTSEATNVATVVTLSSSTPATIAVTPPTVTIPAGQTTGSFTYSGAGVGSATLTATATGYTSTSTVVSATSSGIPANYFGLTVLSVTDPAPKVPYGTTRSWDVTWPSVDWADSNPAPGVYAWAGVDAWLAVNAGKGIDLIYTLGRTPLWASSNPTAPGTYGPGQCAPPTNIADWDNYVTALAQHAAGRIKYWELWNEPNYAVTYCGDIPTMVTMAQHASTIIKSIDPTAVILSPAAVAEAGATWLQTFLTDGGAPYVDVIAFHGYSGASAESMVQTIGYFRNAMEAGGVAKLPMWDTEASWGDVNNVPAITDPASQAAFVAKSYLLQWSQGISRFVWYGWDAAEMWGQLWTSAGGMNQAATAYQQTYNWMVGATLTSPCTADSAGDWYCTFSRSGGAVSEAAWNSTKNNTVTVPAQYTQYLDLQGGVHPIVNHTVTLGNSPILLEN
jgi:hypothetical protein